jgi:hypothetical protein
MQSTLFVMRMIGAPSGNKPPFSAAIRSGPDIRASCGRPWRRAIQPRVNTGLMGRASNLLIAMNASAARQIEKAISMPSMIRMNRNTSTVASNISGPASVSNT